MRTLYQPSISLARGIEIGIYALIEVSKIDALVDSCPQVAVLEMKAGNPNLEIWNEISGGNGGSFGFECDRIESIKNKLSGIEDKRTKMFHLCLDGTEGTKGKLDSALREYESEQSKSKERPQSEPGGTGKVSQ